MATITLLTQEQITALRRHLSSDLSCNNTLKYSIEWMQEHGITRIRANVKKLVDLGGHCDCEVVLNVTPGLWEARRHEALVYPGILGKKEGNDFIAALLWDSTQKELA